MLHLLKSKIELLNERDGLPVLNKHLGAGIFIVTEDATSVHPLQVMYSTAINDLRNLESDNFKDKKTKILGIIDTLIASKDLVIPGRSESLMPLIEGQEKYSKMQEVQFNLLMVEQNNIDFFKSRDCHLPSEPHDRIFCHLIFSVDRGMAYLRFHEGSELPEYIQQQCIDAISQVAPLQQ